MLNLNLSESSRCDWAGYCCPWRGEAVRIMAGGRHVETRVLCLYHKGLTRRTYEDVVLQEVR